MPDENIEVPSQPLRTEPPYSPGANHDGALPAPALPSRKVGGERSAPVECKDNLREIVETIVFVVVLVLLLKSFAAEAFVIPTGSMAETLYGYQKVVVCPTCAYQFPVNCSSEVDPPDNRRQEVLGCICPNCRLSIELRRDDPAWRTGDRVLVAKFLYDTVMQPERFDVVVFKFPEGPQKQHVPMNYIKRLTGQPGETIAIYSGDLYATKDLTYDDQPQPKADSDESRKPEFMYPNDKNAVELFQQQVIEQKEKLEPPLQGKKYAIVRKSPDKILSVRRIVYDNDHPARDLVAKQPPRWTPEPNGGAWRTDDPDQPRRFETAPGAELSWLRYRHILRNAAEPQLITDFMGYNTGKPLAIPQENWVGDLILECDVTIDKPEGELVLELAKGVDRFQARWDLATGICSMVRRVKDKEDILDSKPTDLKKKGSYRIRFANVDERLTLWLDGGLPFGPGTTYKPSRERGPTENDLQPASLGVRGGGVIVEHLRLWRDTYYTTARGEPPNPSAADAEGHQWSYDSEAWRDPSRWEPLRNLQPKTLYVQPNHFLCMGDNSPESSDGRSWGLVPRSLLLGRALMVYYPFNRAGPIR